MQKNLVLGIWSSNPMIFSFPQFQQLFIIVSHVFSSIAFANHFVLNFNCKYGILKVEVAHCHLSHLKKWLQQCHQNKTQFNFETLALVQVKDFSYISFILIYPYILYWNHLSLSCSNFVFILQRAIFHLK
jgi:hypothetical protein